MGVVRPVFVVSRPACDIEQRACKINRVGWSHGSRNAVLVSKSSNRYRLQSNDFRCTWLILHTLTKRPIQYFQGARGPDGEPTANFASGTKPAPSQPSGTHTGYLGTTGARFACSNRSELFAGISWQFCTAGCAQSRGPHSSQRETRSPQFPSVLRVLSITP